MLQYIGGLFSMLCRKDWENIEDLEVLFVLDQLLLKFVREQFCWPI